MNVLVYSGPEVIASSLANTLTVLRSLLTPNYTVQTITTQALQKQPWSASCALLVFPGCSRSPPSSLHTVTAYVENGGSIVGFSTGAKRIGSGLDSIGSLGLSLGSSTDDTPLRFHDRPSKSYITIVPAADTHSAEAKSVSVQASDGSTVAGLKTHASFGDFESTSRTKILGHCDAENAIAGISLDIGSGRATFWAVSLEYPISNDALKLDEEKRLNLLRDTLTESGLRLPSTSENQITRPVPQLLVESPTNTDIVSRVISAVLGMQDISGQKHQDENDVFAFHYPPALASVKSQCQADYLESDDPSAWQPKHIVVYSDGEQPQPEDTPLFSIQTFFKSLYSARIKENCVAKEGSWGFGECLLYGEVVTSTQTMLDKNPRLLASLPVPFVSLASFQLTGRGRGNNVWLSPAGCLQFSILHRVQMGAFPPHKLVFVQYLFALAIVEACRDERVLGKRGEAVRIKWPNDIYAVTRDGEKKKIGGILVNTSFSSGKCDVIIGSGTNIFNPPPIFSLSQLQDPGDPPLSLETTAAVILAKFEAMWTTFIDGNGSFQPFMDLYLQRWLHSDQVVTLTTTTPHKLVRISGITRDHGLLRTVPERTGWEAEDEGFIDLQPDGNSFDLMTGMIRTKS